MAHSSVLTSRPVGNDHKEVLVVMLLEYQIYGVLPRYFLSPRRRLEYTALERRLWHPGNLEDALNL